MAKSRMYRNNEDSSASDVRRALTAVHTAGAESISSEQTFQRMSDRLETFLEEHEEFARADPRETAEHVTSAVAPLAETALIALLLANGLLHFLNASTLFGQNVFFECLCLVILPVVLVSVELAMASARHHVEEDEKIGIRGAALKKHCWTVAAVAWSVGLTLVAVAPQLAAISNDDFDLPRLLMLIAIGLLASVTHLLIVLTGPRLREAKGWCLYLLGRRVRESKRDVAERHLHLAKRRFVEAVLTYLALLKSHKRKFPDDPAGPGPFSGDIQLRIQAMFGCSPEEMIDSGSSWFLQPRPDFRRAELRFPIRKRY